VSLFFYRYSPTPATPAWVRTAWPSGTRPSWPWPKRWTSAARGIATSAGNIARRPSPSRGTRVAGEASGSPSFPGDVGPSHPIHPSYRDSGAR